MPRRPRVFVDGAIYHVYCRTGRGEPIFADEREAAAFLDVLAEVKQRDGLTLLAWCLMANHYHLAVRCGRIPLWRTMRLIQGRFAKSFNRRHGVYGALWQGRYKAKLIEGEHYFQQLILYIHLNPVAAGAAKDPATYRWSGHLELLGKTAATLVDVDDTLLGFGETRAAARRSYLQGVAGAIDSPWLGSDPGRLPWWIGAAAEELSPRAEVAGIDASGAAGGPPRRRLSADEYMDAAASALGLTRNEIAGRRMGGGGGHLHELLAVVGVETFGVKVKDLAALLDRGPTAVSRWISIAGKRRVGDAGFREHCEQLVSAVGRGTAVYQPEESVFLAGVSRGFVD